MCPPQVIEMIRKLVYWYIRSFAFLIPRVQDKLQCYSFNIVL